MKIEYMVHSGDDLLVVNAARASFGKESVWEKEVVDVVGGFETVKVLSDKDKKLINFLAREKHVLPFRHPTITLRCQAPVFVARQLGKHQVGMSWSEESRRYIDGEPEFFWPDKWRKRADNVKQGSSDEEVPVPSMAVSRWADSPGLCDPKEVVELVTMMYNTMLEQGVAPEQARMILPQNMMVTWVWTGTLLSWHHMLQLRLAPDTQKETRDFANMVSDVITPLFPVSMEALRGHSDD